MCAAWCAFRTRRERVRCLVYLYDTWYTYGSLVVIVGHVVHVPVVCYSFRARGARTGRFMLVLHVVQVLISWCVCRTRVGGLVCL